MPLQHGQGQPLTQGHHRPLHLHLQDDREHNSVSNQRFPKIQDEEIPRIRNRFQAQELPPQAHRKPPLALQFPLQQRLLHPARKKSPLPSPETLPLHFLLYPLLPGVQFLLPARVDREHSKGWNRPPPETREQKTARRPNKAEDLHRHQLRVLHRSHPPLLRSLVSDQSVPQLPGSPVHPCKAFPDPSIQRHSNLREASRGPEKPYCISDISAFFRQESHLPNRAPRNGDNLSSSKTSRYFSLFPSLTNRKQTHLFSNKNDVKQVYWQSVVQKGR